MTDDQLDDDEARGGAMLLGSASANGWRVIGRDECASIKVPGGVLQVHPLTAPIFADLATRYHREVEPLVWPGCWGYALRPIKGSQTFSNHASGTAIDLNAPQHPQGVPAARTFTQTQIRALRTILASYKGAIEWGGEWNLPATDGMHFELADDVSAARVEALAARLARDPTPDRPKPAPKPARPPAWTGPDLTGAGLRLRGVQGNNGRRVRALQAELARTYPLYADELADDGWWGPKTSAVLREFAHRSRVTSADGRNIGPRLAAALMRAGIRP